MGYSEMALETNDEESNNNGTRHIKLFEKIVKNANRLNRLFEDFLSVTRIDNNLIVFEKENFNIYDLVKDVIYDLRDVPTIINRMEEKRKNVIIHLEEQHFEANPIVNVDKIKIYQVLINLINNALKYSEANQSITISMKILENEASNEEGNPYLDFNNFNNISYNKDSTSYLVNTCDEGKAPDKITEPLKKKSKRTIIIKIKDKGKGIDKKIFPSLFEKFVTDNNYESGTGLGLYISKRIVEIHGGSIWAENNKDESGATFSFSLPLVN